MNYDDYKRALLAKEFSEDEIERILDEFYHSGIPHVFRGDATAHGQFRRSIANEITSAYELRCHLHNVIVCGSAHLGFSAAPNSKLGNQFDFEKSDIDIAILLPELFDRWWLELVEPKTALGERRDLIANDLLSGFINPKLVREATDTGKKWWKLFGDFSYQLQVRTARC